MTTPPETPDSKIVRSNLVDVTAQWLRRSWCRCDAILFVVVMLVAIATRATTFNRPFERDPEGCGAFYGQLAKNYFRYGVLPTFAVPIQNIGNIGLQAGQSKQAEPIFYPNHPPLLPLLIAGVYAVCGWDSHSNDGVPPEWQTRLPTVLFTLACVATIYLVLRTRAGARAAAIAAILFATMPMTLMFGSQPDVINTQLVFFAILTTLAYLHFAELPNLPRLALLCLAFAPAAATDWPAFHLALILGLHFVFTQPLRRWGWIIAFGGVCAVYFFGLYVEVVAVRHDWNWMTKLVARRALGSETDSGNQITLMGWFQIAIGRRMVDNHTIPVILAMLGWIGLAITALRRHPATRLIAILLGWALLHIVVGRQGVYVHEWWWWPLTPGVAMAAGVAIDCAMQQLVDRRRSCRIANALLAVVLIVFAGRNVIIVQDKLAHPNKMVNNELDYSISEMGQAIRAAAPLNECVMLAEDDKTLGIWYYADRPIKQKIWYAAEFERRLTDGYADLPFDIWEPWPKAPAAVVIPKAYANDQMQPFVDYLSSRYPRRDSAKFMTFDLTARRAN